VRQSRTCTTKVQRARSLCYCAPVLLPQCTDIWLVCKRETSSEQFLGSKQLGSDQRSLSKHHYGLIQASIFPFQVFKFSSFQVFKISSFQARTRLRTGLKDTVCGGFVFSHTQTQTHKAAHSFTRNAMNNVLNQHSFAKRNEQHLRPSSYTPKSPISAHFLSLNELLIQTNQCADNVVFYLSLHQLFLVKAA